MNRDDRARIDRLCKNVISNSAKVIDMRILLPRLIENGVFKSDDVNMPRWEEILANEGPNQSMVFEVLDTVKTRGPQAFKNLVLSLRQTGHYDAADIVSGTKTSVPIEKDLNENREPLTFEDDANSEEPWYCKHALTNSEKPLVIKVKPATKFRDEPDSMSIPEYRMRTKPHGYVLIITIIAYKNKPRRIAAEHDQKNLKKLFEDMGFEVTVPDPAIALTGKEIKRIVKEFSQREFHKVDSCFVIMSAHGNEVERQGVREMEIHGIDYNDAKAERVLRDDIVDMFNTVNCQHLVGKPKVFIFQACRGTVQQPAVRHEVDGFSTNQTSRLYSDILIAHSTMSGYEAHRDLCNGSWYIQTLCEVFMRCAYTMHLTDLLKKVDSELKHLRTVDGYAQTATVEDIGFNKHLYLYPGLFEDS